MAPSSWPILLLVWFYALFPLAMSSEHGSRISPRNYTVLEQSTIGSSWTDGVTDTLQEVRRAANASRLQQKSYSLRQKQRRALLNEPEVEVRRLPAVRIEWTRSKDSVGWSSSNDPRHATAAKCIHPAPFGQQVCSSPCIQRLIFLRNR